MPLVEGGMIEAPPLPRIFGRDMDAADAETWLLAEGDTAEGEAVPSESPKSQLMPGFPMSLEGSMPCDSTNQSLNSMASSLAQVSQSCCVYSTSLRTCNQVMQGDMVKISLARQNLTKHDNYDAKGRLLDGRDLLIVYSTCHLQLRKLLPVAELEIFHPHQSIVLFGIKNLKASHEEVSGDCQRGKMNSPQQNSSSPKSTTPPVRQGSHLTRSLSSLGLTNTFELLGLLLEGVQLPLGPIDAKPKLFGPTFADL